jgi:predicted secreted hydrolase
MLPSTSVYGRRKVAAIAAGFALVLGTPLAAAAAPQRADPVSVATPQPGPTTDPGFPTFVHLPADQAAHPGVTWEWWYTIGHFTAGGHKYGYEVQLSASGLVQIGLSDMTEGTFDSEVTRFPAGTFSTSSTTLDVRMPNASLSGPINNMHLKADLPHDGGTIDLTLNAVGPSIYDNGTGLFPFLGGTSYYYSLPNLRTTGTLTQDGKAQQVTGTSWLDRQWGDWDWSKVHKWTWMALQLSNGQTLNLWDLFDNTGETHWATVLSPDGSERVVSVEPLARHATNFQTSPATGQRYAGKWTVKIPSLGAVLTVTARPVLQEMEVGLPWSPGINEAASSTYGTYQGRPVTGEAFVEQYGIWP